MASPPPPPDPIFALRGHQGDVTSVSFHPASQTILSTSTDTTVRIWDIKTRRSLSEKRLNAPAMWVQALSGDRLLAYALAEQCRGGAVSILCATASMDVSQTMQTHSVGFCKAAVHEDMMAMPCEEDGKVALWDLRTGNAIASVLETGEEKTGLCMAIQLYQQSAVAFFENGFAYCWELSSRKVISTLKLHAEPIICAAASVDGVAGVSGCAGTSIVRFECKSMQLQSVSALTLPQPGINDVRIRGDEKIYATAGWDHRVRVFSWRKNTPLAVLKFHTGAINCVAFQPSSNLLAAASADGRIAVWSIY